MPEATLLFGSEFTWVPYVIVSTLLTAIGFFLREILRRMDRRFKEIKDDLKGAHDEIKNDLKESRMEQDKKIEIVRDELTRFKDKAHEIFANREDTIANQIKIEKSISDLHRKVDEVPEKILKIIKG